MKVAKEEIVGLVAALRIFAEEDEESETERYVEVCQRVVDALIEVPGLEVSVKHDRIDYLIPTAVLRFTPKWTGPSPSEVFDRMAAGDPPIFMHTLGNPDQLGVDPMSVDERELETVIRRLGEELGTFA